MLTCPEAEEGSVQDLRKVRLVERAQCSRFISTEDDMSSTPEGNQRTKCIKPDDHLHCVVESSSVMGCPWLC